LVGILTKHLAVKLVRARLGHRGDDRGAGLLILRLVVLREYAELLHRELAERIAAAVLLAGDAALAQLVLETDAVDEHIDLARGRCAGADALVGLAVIVAHARSQRREREEVAIALRQDADLILTDICRDFAGAGLDQPRP